MTKQNLSKMSITSSKHQQPDEQTNQSFLKEDREQIYILNYNSACSDEE